VQVTIEEKAVYWEDPEGGKLVVRNNIEKSIKRIRNKRITEY
jgi:hypothetical protein